ncbi:thioredoxin-2, putative [Pediculus humanus corporis]|uniref:Thioredoxin n=1 Tax=Pediculus humanus subsp. corporis TaxID=121224 RepID=E0VFG1_PEDHC|nr:thioredoxin-2, putative [Pediculus humanus corporis]EEB12117.1 thioredoxin-2, putative [Pediculus humanus corporis]
MVSLTMFEHKDLSVKIQEAGNKLVVIDFYAVWCGPCKQIAPKIEELELQYTNVVFLKVDIDENEEIAADYDISAMPTFVFIKNGNKLDSFTGANITKLQSTVDKYL